MDSIEFDGVTYVKASVAAKRFSYTQDYVGQLCRGKKVDARLVGRTWFVNPDSIDNHKEGKYKKGKDKDVKADELNGNRNSFSVDISTPTKRAPVEVPSVQKRDPAQFVNIVPAASFHKKEKYVAVEYDQDESSLMPNLKKIVLPPPTTLHVAPANAKKLKIKNVTRSNTKMRSEAMPDVALSGSIPVKEIPLEAIRFNEDEDASEEVLSDEREDCKVDTENLLSNIDISSRRDIVGGLQESHALVQSTQKHIPSDVSDKVGAREFESDHSSSRSQAGKLHLHASGFITIPLPNSVSHTANTAPKLNFTPDSVAVSMVSKKSVQLKPAFFVPAAVAVTAVLFAVGILSAVSSIEVSGTGSEAGVIFQAPDFSRI